mmetsp:Transcript_62356/g.99168  ORF Transcript_62356/g.99168 Transcript_62356/m.99168 type:complete len:91 (-) Transcript_62356:58-330(-)
MRANSTSTNNVFWMNTKLHGNKIGEVNEVYFEMYIMLSSKADIHRNAVALNTTSNRALILNLRDWLCLIRMHECRETAMMESRSKDWMRQ